MSWTTGKTAAFCRVSCWATAVAAAALMAGCSSPAVSPSSGSASPAHARGADVAAYAGKSRHHYVPPAVGAPGFPANVYPAPPPRPVVNSVGHCPASAGLRPFTAHSADAARRAMPKFGHSLTQDLRLADRTFWPVLIRGWQPGATRVFTPGRPAILYSGPLESYHSSEGPPDFTKLISAGCGPRLARNTWMIVDGPRRSPALQGELLFLNRRGHVLLYYAQ
jgi:hypothetical protein